MREHARQWREREQVAQVRTYLSRGPVVLLSNGRDDLVPERARAEALVHPDLNIRGCIRTGKKTGVSKGIHHRDLSVQEKSKKAAFYSPTLAGKRRKLPNYTPEPRGEYAVTATSTVLQYSISFSCTRAARSVECISAET